MLDKAEIVSLVVPRFERQPVGIMLVRREAGPAALADREQFRYQKPSDFVAVLRAEYVFDLAMCIIVRAILNAVNICFPDGKRLQDAVQFYRDKNLGSVRFANQLCFRASRAVDALRFAVPDINATLAYVVKMHALNLDIHGSGCRNRARFIAGDLMLEDFAASGLMLK